MKGKTGLEVGLSRVPALVSRRKRLKHVALIVDTQLAPRRRMLDGVARYVQEHEPWAIYLKPYGVEKFLDEWLRDWGGDGIIAAVHEPIAEVLSSRGIPVVDVVAAFHKAGVPAVRTHDFAVGKAGAEHLASRGFKHFGFVEYEGERVFWSEQRRVGFESVVKENSQTQSCSIYRQAFVQSGGGGEPGFDGCDGD